MRSPIQRTDFNQAAASHSPGYHPDEASIQLGWDETLKKHLRPISLSLGVLFAFFAISHLLLLPPDIAPFIAGLAEATAIALLIFYLVSGKMDLPLKWVPSLGAGIAALALANSLLYIHFSANPNQTVHLGLFIIGAGFFLLSTNWLTAIILTTLSGWGLLVVLNPSLNWIQPGLFLLLATTLSIAIHLSQSKNLRRLEELRRQDAHRKAELESVLLYTEETQRSLATSMAIGQRITSILDQDVLLNQVADLIKDRFGVMYVGIFLLDESGEFVVARAGTGEIGRSLGREGYRLKVGEEGLIGWVAQKRRPAYVGDVSKDPRYLKLEAMPETRSELVLPLEMSQTLLGVLDMQSAKPDAFHDDDVPFMQLLADQVAIALQNARLYEKIRHFNKDLELMVQQRTEDLQAAYHELERLDRTKSDFISVASHELRTPITVVHGYCQMLLDDPLIRESSLHTQLVNGIHSGAVRLNDIVSNLLDSAKIDSRALQLHPGPVLLYSLIEYVCSTLEKALEDRNQTLKLDDLRSLPSIEADPESLKKVFHNLLVNAIKYTPDGGAITISSRCLGKSEETGPPNAIEIIISDTGIGIDPGLQELIFVKFYQTGEVAFHSSGKVKFKGGGPGLGLAIAKGIIEAHGGRIWVESPGYDEEYCPGSQFHVVLPLKQ
jgi:signal transduction histidine kinase